MSPGTPTNHTAGMRRARTGDSDRRSIKDVLIGLKRSPGAIPTHERRPNDNEAPHMNGTSGATLTPLAPDFSDPHGE